MSNRLRGRFPNRSSNRVTSWVLTAGGVAANLDIDFVNDLAYNSSTTTIASLLSCSRASSSGYYTKADGTLTSFGANTLRYGTNGLLVEEQRTNLLARSQEFDNASWNKLGTVSVSADQIAAPDGNLTADKLIESNATQRQIIYQGASVTNAVTYSYSCYAKAGTRTKIYLKADKGTNNPGAIFNLSNGTVDASANCTASIASLASGWYRCVIVYTQDTTGLKNHHIGLSNTTSLDVSSEVSYAGDGASYAYIWGAQVEAGAFATSYFPTTSASATRNADLVTFSSTSFFNGATDTIYASWVARNVNNAKVWALDAANDVLLDEQTGMSARISDAGGTFAITVGNTASAGATVKAAAAVTSNDAAICMNGGTVGTDATVTVAGSLSASRLGCDLSGSNYLNGLIKRVAYWPSRVSNANLITLTT